MPTAVLFDIDRTLVDSHYLHVEAWDYAFTATGLTVPSWRIHRLIGTDSRALLAELVGAEPTSTIQQLNSLHRQRYDRLAPRLRLLEGSRELLQTIAAQGPRVVLLTSAPEKERVQLRHLLGSDDDDVYAVIPADNLRHPKPASEIVRRALRTSEVDADRAFMIGDCVWDVLKAQEAGVKTVALLSGGIGSDLLRDAGATAIYADPAALLDGLDTSPLAELWA